MFSVNSYKYSINFLFLPKLPMFTRKKSLPYKLKDSQKTGHILNSSRIRKQETYHIRARLRAR